MNFRPLAPAALLLFLAGCATIRIHPYQLSALPPTTTYVAGASIIDITPPPGYPLGGHSIGGRMADGYWQRLHARAFYFQDTAGHQLALVSCDLFAIPAALRYAVAAKLGWKPESLIIAATHTHQGPAGFMSSSVFNFGGPIPGFDENLYKHLTDWLYAVVHAAQSDATGHNGNVSVRLYSGAAGDLQRNRAIDAFFRNSGALQAQVLATSAGKVTCPDPDSGGHCPRYQAVNPELNVLELRRGGRRFGLMVFYAIHNTAMDHNCPLYQSDLSGYAMAQLEQAQPGLVAGFFNGAEGDISPRFVTQDRQDVELFGGTLARNVTALLAGNPLPADQPDPALTYASRDFKAVPTNSDTEGLTLPGSGVGELGGAEDGRTVMYAYGWHGGVTLNASDVKKPALDLHDFPPLQFLGKILGSPSNYPQSIPVAVASIGSLHLAAIPTEMTTAQGLELRGKLQAVRGDPYLLIGLANEYIGYTTTANEYKVQNYEAASTMYGPQQGAVIERLLTTLATDQKSTPIRKLTYQAGSKLAFGPDYFSTNWFLPYPLSYEDLEPVMPDPTHRPDDGAPRFEWTETDAADWLTGDRHVRILTNAGGAWSEADNDQADDILTVMIKAWIDNPTGTHFRKWTAIWAPPSESLLPPAERRFPPTTNYIFRVDPPKGAPVCSVPFQLNKAVASIPTDAKDHADACPPGTEPNK